MLEGKKLGQLRTLLFHQCVGEERNGTCKAGESVLHRSVNSSLMDYAASARKAKWAQFSTQAKSERGGSWAGTKAPDESLQQIRLIRGIPTCDQAYQSRCLWCKVLFRSCCKMALKVKQSHPECLIDTPLPPKLGGHLDLASLWDWRPQICVCVRDWEAVQMRHWEISRLPARTSSTSGR